MHVRTADFGSTLQMASSARSARARSDVTRGWADYFVSTHACRAWLLHEYLHPTAKNAGTRKADGHSSRGRVQCSAGSRQRRTGYGDRSPYDRRKWPGIKGPKTFCSRILNSDLAPGQGFEP